MHLSGLCACLFLFFTFWLCVCFCVWQIWKTNTSIANEFCATDAFEDLFTVNTAIDYLRASILWYTLDLVQRFKGY